MINFEYKGISAGKYVEGEIEAINNSEAAYKLKEQKVIITKLVKAKKKKEVKSGGRRGSEVESPTRCFGADPAPGILFLARRRVVLPGDSSCSRVRAPCVPAGRARGERVMDSAQGVRFGTLKYFNVTKFETSITDFIIRFIGKLKWSHTLNSGSDSSALIPYPGTSLRVHGYRVHAAVHIFLYSYTVPGYPYTALQCTG